MYLGPNESLFHSTDVSLYTMPLHIGVFLGFRCLTLFSCPSSPLSAAFIRAQIASLPKAFVPMTPATLQKQQGCVTRGPPVLGAAYMTDALSNITSTAGVHVQVAT